MSFSSFANTDAVAKAYGVTMATRKFMGQVTAELPSYFQKEIFISLEGLPINRTESGCSETLIFPILREFWKLYSDSLSLFSHEPIEYDRVLNGAPDYLITRRSRFGPTVFDQPLLIVVEAKRDDFMRGWAQCFAAMVAAQLLNQPPVPAIYGCSTNGLAWQFAKLENQEFCTDTRTYSITNFDELTAALNWVFVQCREQMQPRPAAA